MSKRVNPAFVLVPIVGAIVVVGSMVCCFGYFGFVQGSDVPVTQADRDLVVTPELVSPWMVDGHDVQPRKELFTKSRFWDGSCTVEYEYDGIDAAAPLYILHSVDFEPTADDARWVMSGAKIAFDALLPAFGEDITMGPAPDLVNWGQDTECKTVFSAGAPLGSYCLSRKGAKVSTLAIFGVYFDEPGALDVVAGEPLAYVDGFTWPDTPCESP